MAEAAYFLAVRFPLEHTGFESAVEYAALPEPKPTHETQAHPFYRVDHPILAEQLVDLFKAKHDGNGDYPPIFGITDASDVSQRILYLDGIRKLQDDISRDQWGIQQGSGEWLDRRRVFLMNAHKQAHDWEPLVRNELADDIYPPQPVAPLAPPTPTNTIGPRFLTVRLLYMCKTDDCTDCVKDDPSPLYEGVNRVFYETDSQAVARRQGRPVLPLPTG